MLAGALDAAMHDAEAGTAAHAEKAESGPSLQLIDLSGYQEIVANSSGKALMVTFWATWCQPCRAEFPMIVELGKKYGPQGLRVVGVSLDEDSDLGPARQFLEQTHVEFPNYRVRPSIDMDSFYRGVNPAWKGTMPQTIFYGRDGHIARYLIGARPQAAFEDAVRLILVKSTSQNPAAKATATGE